MYNITHYLKYHPGGVKVLIGSAGKDGTALFEKHHRCVYVEGQGAWRVHKLPEPSAALSSVCCWPDA